MILEHRYDGPSVNLAFPPVGWHKTLEHAPHKTTVWACEKTVVIAKQPRWAGNRKHSASLKMIE